MAYIVLFYIAHPAYPATSYLSVDIKSYCQDALIRQTECPTSFHHQRPISVFAIEPPLVLRNWLCTRLPVFPINCYCTVVSQGCAYQRSSPVTFFLLFTVTIKGKVVCGMSVCNMSSQIGLAYSAAPRTLVRAGTEGPPE